MVRLLCVKSTYTMILIAQICRKFYDSFQAFKRLTILTYVYLYFRLNEPIHSISLSLNILPSLICSHVLILLTILI